MSAQQPFLHDLALTLAAPVQVWSAADGSIDGTGVQGAYYGDRRVRRGLQVRLAGPDGPIGLVHGSTSTGIDGTVTFHDRDGRPVGTSEPRAPDPAHATTEGELVQHIRDRVNALTRVA